MGLQPDEHALVDAAAGELVEPAQVYLLDGDARLAGAGGEVAHTRVARLAQVEQLARVARLQRYRAGVHAEGEVIGGRVGLGAHRGHWGECSASRCDPRSRSPQRLRAFGATPGGAPSPPGPLSRLRGRGGDEAPGRGPGRAWLDGTRPPRGAAPARRPDPRAQSFARRRFYFSICPASPSGPSG